MFLDEPCKAAVAHSDAGGKGVLKMTYAAAAMDFLEEAKILMAVLSKAMKSVCYIYHAEFCDF